METVCPGTYHGYVDNLDGNIQLKLGCLKKKEHERRHSSLEVQGGLWEQPLSREAGAQVPWGGDVHALCITRS